ncbi:substrate-binding periplasmic protein [Aliikangiella maris]|uniref:Transporter substrate-binding domain-containing protein n=2 Tax=Aliikangiella maris TaxID=3162458 RepID=A0ABV2BQF4_9GAMM
MVLSKLYKQALWFVLVIIGVILFWYFNSSFSVVSNSQSTHSVESEAANSNAAQGVFQHGDACLLKVGWTDWPPYLVANDENQPSGFQIEFIQWVSQHINCKLTYRRLTWQNALGAIRTGEIDVLGRASKFIERERYAHFSEPYRMDMLALTVREETRDKHSVKNLREFFDAGLKLGVLQGGYFGPEVEAIRRDIKYRANFIEYPLEIDIINALDNLSVDGIFEAPFTIEQSITKNQNKHRFVKYPIEILIGPLHFMFSKKTVSKQQVEAFNQAMKKVKQSQQYKDHWFWTMIQ